MSNAPTPMGMSTIEVDGSVSVPKRRLSDASEDSNVASKSKKYVGPDGKLVKDGSNKTKSGRFKPGAPIDLDEQCGVVTEKNVLCSRSLTCKTHGMGSKRAVPGRSKPFDSLLLEFQKKKEHRMKLKAEREKAQEEQRLKEGGDISVGGSSSNNNIKVPVEIEGGDIAVPQAGTSASQSIRLLSPSPLNSIAVPTPSNMDDIPIHQSHHEFAQPFSQPSKPPTTSMQQASNSSLPPHQQQQADSNASNAPSVPTAKVKTTQLQSSAAGSTATPSKAAASGASAPTSTKKKKTGEGGKTGKSKASARNKADLILGEVDDPPEPANAAAASSTLIGADGNFIVEEEAPDSDDEVDQLLVAMNQSRARPLALPTYPPYERSPMKLAKYRESFLTAFTGRSMSSSAS
ncbi:SCA7-domain-containing protein [Cystobasidium minutum MCA 4210]|uniref:SCA7-domain-containing protein n=1 Tax=Cystobasidium minutum MCA 4210 TaxID=1397322 RepID=UPI0034CEC0E4|eukprot:jgi/Rhomi1/167936/fgenesh1_kg.2_\